MARDYSIDHTHDLINIAVARETITRLQSYVESRKNPDPKAAEETRIAAAEACRSASAYLGGYAVLIDRQDAVLMRQQSKEYEDAIRRVHDLEQELASVKKPKSKKKAKPKT